MIQKIFILAFLALSITGCETTTITSTKKAPESQIEKTTEQPQKYHSEKTTKKSDPKPELANFPFAKWKGRNIYDFFYEVFEEGTPVSSFTNEVFSTSEYKGVSWEIIQASHGMNVVGVYVKSQG